MSMYGTGKARAYALIEDFTVGVSSTQAGGHPNLKIDAEFANRYYLNQEPQDNPPTGSCCQDVEEFVIHTPAGFIGNPHAVPQCSLTEFALNECSPDTQVGEVFIRIPGFNEEYPAIKVWEEKVGESVGFVSPIYNLQPRPGQAGAFGSIAPLINAPVETALTARTGSDYGLDARTSGLFHYLPIPRLALYLWGNPASAEHDRSRFTLPHTPSQAFCVGTLNDQRELEEAPHTLFGYGCHEVEPSSAANNPYLENPTACGSLLSAGLELGYYDGTRLHADTAWPATTGCDQLKFNPSATAKATTAQADTSSGLDLNLHVPQTQSPSVPAPSEVRSVKITLPPGFSLTPSGADGKTSCADNRLNFEAEDAAECPEFAKIGTSTLDSSALPGPIPGAMYIGQPLPDETFRLFLTADGFSTHVKLKGAVHLDQETGQIVTEFNELPQSPFQEFDMHFFGSERGIFATPVRCGDYPVEATFIPWAAALPTQNTRTTFDLTSGPNGSPCPEGTRPFAPTFRSGTPNNTAGATTSLTVQVKRDDGDQFLSKLSVQLPRGLIQSIRGVAECPETALAKVSLASYSGLLESALPACPLASQIGTVVGATGAGTRNLYNSGRIFLAGPYKGAPVSLVTVIPALGGPYDLGNVVVRAAAYVNAETAQVKAVSDPLPQILDGIPLRVRSILLKFDRPGFNHLPTNCDPKSIDGEIGGSEGSEISSRAYYQVANCASLKYEPRLSFRLSAGVGRRGHPAIHAVLRTQPGEANSQSVSVTLPQGELLDNAHIGTVCTRVDFSNGNCPTASAIGHAEATTPLLDDPLAGTVYLRSSTRALPDLVADLKGKVNLVLVGHVSAVNGRLKTVFDNLPDAEITSFALDLDGGKKGLLQNTQGLCGSKKRAAIRMTGQNGSVFKTHASLHPDCGSSGRRRGNRQGGNTRKAVH